MRTRTGLLVSFLIPLIAAPTLADRWSLEDDLIPLERQSREEKAQQLWQLELAHDSDEALRARFLSEGEIPRNMNDLNRKKLHELFMERVTSRIRKMSDHELRKCLIARIEARHYIAQTQLEQSLNKMQEIVDCYPATPSAEVARKAIDASGYRLYEGRLISEGELFGLSLGGR